MSQELPTDITVREWFVRYSNWGRWGTDDLLGTLNHITADMVRDAATSVSSGQTVSLGWDISPLPGPGLDVVPQRWMRRTGLGYEPGAESPVGPRLIDNWAATASELISLVFHGSAITHLDALSHFFWEGKMYNGVSAAYVTDRDGAALHDIRSAASGIQARGVLLDIPRVRNVSALALGEPVFPQDLEAAEKAQGVTVGPGDVLLVRLGEGSRRVAGDWNPADGRAGLHAACIPWLHERSIAALGSDGAQDVMPSGYSTIRLPVHSVGIVAMGLWLIDNCQLEDVAAMCAKLGTWSFFFNAGPLRFAGATGSPINPLALF